MGNTPGKGTSLSISISGTPTAITQLVSVTPPAVEMGTTETTHLGSTWREFIANILDGGEMTLTANYDSAAATHAAVWSQMTAGTLAAFLITFTDSGATTVGFNGIITNFEIGEATVDNLVTLAVTVKVSGAVTITP